MNASGQGIPNEHCNENCNLVDEMIAWENGGLDENESIKLFSKLVTNGMAWTLQGMYGRFAKSLIDVGYLSPSGKILKEYCEE